jgi:hypothetical protein
MARISSVVASGYPHHVTQRGVRSISIFQTKKNGKKQKTGPENFNELTSASNGLQHGRVRIAQEVNGLPIRSRLAMS